MIPGLMVLILALRSFHVVAAALCAWRWFIRFAIIYASPELCMATSLMMGSSISSSVGVFSICSSMSLGIGYIYPVWLEMRSPLPPSAITLPNASTAYPVPTMSRLKICSGFA